MTDFITHKPSGWDIKNLENVAKFITKGATPTTYGFKWVEESSDSIPFLRSECVTANGFNRKGMNFISKKAHMTMERSKIKSGDILMTITGNIGRIATLPDEIPEANINQHIAKISVIDGVSSSYVAQALQQERYNRYYERILTGQAYPQISLKQVRETPILLPPYPEQQKIAEVLSTVDKKIDLIDQKIAETEKLKTGLMQKLFSEGVGIQDENGNWQPHTEFQDSIYGNIPKTWKLSKLNQVTDYVDYRGKTPPKVESGTFLVTAKNIKNGFIDYECSKEYIPLELYDDVMSRGKPKLGDVVFTTEAPLGNVALIDRSDVAIAQRVIKFRPKDDICLDSGYLKHFMLSTYFQKELLQNATGSTVLGVKGKRLHVMLVCLPSINEQKMIVDILNEIDRKKHFLELQKAETQQLKKGLMQKLLTGEWRVPVEVTEAA
ncbi:restriction endonuclease subunit S [Shewanella indica]|uniref:restriction endonuclease subunit S n=1 Tax=Shewanella indica TaxID=768528 RepID=UPI00399BCB83